MLHVDNLCVTTSNCYTVYIILLVMFSLKNLEPGNLHIVDLSLILIACELGCESCVSIVIPWNVVVSFEIISKFRNQKNDEYI